MTHILNLKNKKVEQDSTVDNNWKKLKRARDDKGAYHAYPDGTPAYEERYGFVFNFSEGLAAVRDFNENYFHITPDGKPAYTQRYIYVEDFSKEGLARARERDSQYYYVTKEFHIRRDGQPAYEQRYKIVRTFSGGLCTVMDFDRSEFHIKPDGSPAYSQRYWSVGKFYDDSDLAWVEDFDGFEFDINKKGERVN